MLELFIGLLKEELRRELHLARRSGVASRGPRIRNHSECRAVDQGNAARLAKVRHIEQIEHLDAQLHTCLARQREVLDERQIGVVEPRPVDLVLRFKDL